MFVLANQPTCPMCGKVLDATTAADGSNDVPRAGDLTVCAGCFVCLRFNKNLELEFQPLGGLEPDVRQAVIDARMKIGEFKRRFGLT